jgi:hypothetical protein
VSWDRDPADHTRHLIKLHCKRAAEERVDIDRLAIDMVDALIECSDCTITPPKATDGSVYQLVVTIPTAEAPRPAPVVAAAPRPAPVVAAMGGAGGPSRPRALAVMRAMSLVWHRDSRDDRIHYVKHRRDQEPRILAELARCYDCTIELTPRDPDYMCVITMH